MLKKAGACLLAGFLLTGADYLGNKQFEKTENIAGVSVNITVFQSTLSYDARKQAVDKAFTLIQSQMDSLTGPEGWQAQIARAKQGAVLTVDDSFAAVLKQSVVISKLSEGSFDLTSGPLRAVWQSAKENLKAPEEAALQSALKTVGYKGLDFDAITKKLTINREGVQIDLKDEMLADAVDRAAEFLSQQGVSAAIIDAGYVLRTIGKDPASERWRLGLEHPRVLEEYMGTIDVDGNRSVSTYGDYDDFFMSEGKRYALHIDAKTGLPPAHKVVSASVIAKNSLSAVLLAKTLFILGPEKGYELIDRLKEDGVEAISIEEQAPNKFILGGTDGAQSYLKDIRI